MRSALAQVREGAARAQARATETPSRVNVGAGEMVAENGRIVLMTSHSGHDWPSPEFQQEVLDVLAAEGVDGPTTVGQAW